MTRNLHMPASGEEISASWGRDVIAELRAQALTVVPPLMLARTPSGTTLRVKLPAAAAAAEEVPQPWSVSFTGAEAAFANCVYLQGGLLKTAEPEAYEVAGADGAIWLAAWLDTASGTAEIHEGGTLAEVTDAEISETPDIFKIPLYKITKKTSGSDVSLRVSLRYLSGIPALPAPPDGVSLQPAAEGKTQIYAWDNEDNGTASGISQVLKADPVTGKITASGSHDGYELLVRVGGAGGAVGYMPIGEGDGSDPESPDDKTCDQNQHPASGGGGAASEHENNEHSYSGDDVGHPGEGDNGTGGDTGNTQHPASDDCYTTAY